MRDLWRGNVTIGKALLICIALGYVSSFPLGQLVIWLGSPPPVIITAMLVTVAALAITGMSSIGLWRSTTKQTASDTLKVIGKIASVTVSASVVLGAVLVLGIGILSLAGEGFLSGLMVWLLYLKWH